MESKVVELENTRLVPVEADAASLLVELGWNLKSRFIVNRVIDAIEVAASGNAPNSYNLDLSAIIEYTGKRADLICHGRGLSHDRAESVILGADSRTGFRKGVNERITVYMDRIPSDVKRVIFFVNVNDGESDLKYLGDVADVFVKIRSGETVIYSEEQAFLEEEAKDAVSFTFAALTRDGGKWSIRGLSRYAAGDNVYDVYEGMEGEPFRKPGL